MNDMTMKTHDVEDVERNENLVRDYLLHQLQLNLLHSQYQDKAHSEAVEELMEAKRAMQEYEANVVRKFAALNEQYEQINGILYPEEVRKLEKHQEMVFLEVFSSSFCQAALLFKFWPILLYYLKTVKSLSVKRKAILNEFSDDAKAYLAYHRARLEQLSQLEEEIRKQEEEIIILDAQISAADKLLSS
uniref:Uncharacterized protein n=1 Tax=Setaria digitata TaxID=48799 RepID=A0A915PWH2_9BILA